MRTLAALGLDGILAAATLALMGAVLCGIFPGCARGPACVTTCAAAVSACEPVAATRYTLDARGNITASTPLGTSPTAFADCVAACARANCLAGCP